MSTALEDTALCLKAVHIHSYHSHFLIEKQLGDGDLNLGMSNVDLLSWYS